MLASIIIPVFNLREDTERCLEAIFANPPATSFEVIVVDDGSSDGTGDLRTLDKDQRFEVIGRLADDLMAEVSRIVPVLPVSLIATVLIEAEQPIDELDLKLRAGRLMEHFEDRGAKLYLPRGDRDYAFHVGLRMLALRHLVETTADGLYTVVPAERPLLAYYAHAIAHSR